MLQVVAHWDHLVAHGVEWIKDWKVKVEGEEVQPFLARTAVMSIE